MAEGVLFNVIQPIIENLASEPLEKIRLPLWYNGELRKLKGTITMIKAVILDAEEKKETNNQFKVWLESLEDDIYDADNLVDEFRYQQLRRKVLFGKKRAKKVRIFFSRSKQLAFRVKMANKIKQIREKLDEIKGNQVFSQLDKCEHGETRLVSSITSGRETHSFVINDHVIGRDNDKKEILDFLLGNNLEAKESVTTVSLVGIGGLGKTTLAQLVYNDELVKRNFWLTIWVCVSDVFDLKLLIQKIIRSVDNASPDQNLDLDQLQNQLRQKIQDKRYLLVLDDVWNEDINKWHRLKECIMPGAKGSKVLITTRSIKVAQIVHSTKTHMLSGLDKDKSWALLERVAFDEEINEPTTQYQRLVEIGKDIVGKCGGVPIAIETIGRILQIKKNSSQNFESEWIKFRDMKLAEVDYQYGSGILSTLMLSYNNIPSHLKHCFAYCSLFPKDHRINVQQLIKLWIAQGFIKHVGSNSQLEDIGYEYFMILFSMCFFQEAEIDELSRAIKYCKMHDLMHDLASLVAGKSIQIFYVNTSNIELAENGFEKVCHISVDFANNNSSCQIPKLLFEEKQMRTFILPESKILSSLYCDDIVSNFRFLRALSLRIERNVETLPNGLGKLKHLRYLNLSNNPHIKELPNSITELYNLQTLILSSCSSLLSLPPGIRNLINLRHLEIRGCGKLTHMPCGIGELMLLQTLDMFVVAGNVSSESAGFDELSKLYNLHGGLTIHIRGLGELEAAKYLKEKKHLESLVLSWELEETMGDDAKVAFECLEPPQNIKSIQVLNYPGEKFPNYLSSLTILARLELSGCEKCKYLPPLHHLSSLQELKLNSLSALEYVSERDMEWIKECFPSLTTLVISECVKMKGWWGREGKDFGEVLTEHQQPSFPILSKLIIVNCPLLTSMPLFPNLQYLKLHNTSSKPFEIDTTVAATSSTFSFSSSPSPLSKLKHLDIQFIHDLENLLPKATHELPLLQSLSINNCSKLASLPEGISNLKSLQNLAILNCENLSSLPEGIGGLPSLTHLTIVGCNNLKSIPKGIGSLQSITYITIVGCSNLTKIPNEIGSLTSLEYVNGQNFIELPKDSLADYLLRQNSPA
ncbi:putative disease resistance protein RGA3 [Morus notabilis]|uniref:putative disease resistance protein RGA3 n=1 Tax=Morus notabilis TaxID=981085 RepID=UPI000CECF7E6|nr:putative disease resistance protein RGA3 [Morus notabilis]